MSLVTIAKAEKLAWRLPFSRQPKIGSPAIVVFPLA